MQCACAILSFVACTGLQYFSILSHKIHEFRRKKLQNIRCVLIISLNLSEMFPTLRRIERDMIKNVFLLLNYYTNHCTCIKVSLLHRACCLVTQLLHQPLHVYKIFIVTPCMLSSYSIITPTTAHI